jgi:ribose 5-phosphate isomerase B
MGTMVYLGADHGGFRLKEHLKRQLLRSGMAVTDFGSKRLVPSDDYPVVAERLALAVTRTPESRGVLLCRTGIGVVMAANKVPGIRAAMASTPTEAHRARTDEDANILALGADRLTRRQAEHLVRVFLRTAFTPRKRHARRIQQLARIDARYRRPRR